MLINEYENSRKLIGDPLASLGFFFENMAQEVQGASILCNDEDFLLLRLMKDLAGAHPDRMLGAAGAMKNCCFHSELHATIASHRDLAALLCLNLVGSSETFDDDDREGMQTGLAAKCRVGGKVSESGELRKTIYEAMKLLTRSRVGRDYLRGEKIYPVIREVRARRPPRGTAVPGRVRSGPGEEGCGGGVGVSHASGSGAARRGLSAGRPTSLISMVCLIA